MAKNKINKILGAIAVGAVIMAVPGCADDHFDNTDVLGEGQTTATMSLWDIISSKPELSRFASIAQHTKYWKDEKHEVKDYSFEDVLKSGQVSTVWAPTNDYLTESEYNKWMQMCETDGFSVQQQFMSNHISQFRHIYTDSKVDTIKTLNGKNMEFNKANLSFQGIPVIEKNIPAVNGTLHTIAGITPFHYNFYEQLKYGKDTKKYTEYLLSKDTVYFSEYASIEGIPDENGNPTYNDSVYYTSNLLFNRSFLPNSNSEDWDIAQKGFAFSVNAEDSVIVMCVPSDEAWDQALEDLKSMYVYPSTYEEKRYVTDKAAPTRTIADPDSLAKMSMEQDMIVSSVFNIHKQPKIGGETGVMWTLDKFVSSRGAEADYVLNTRGDTIRATEDWKIPELFNGKEMPMSNGMAFISDKWAFPSHFIMPDIEINLNGGSFFGTSYDKFYKVGSTTGSKSFNNEVYKEITDIYGKVYNNDFFFIENYNGGVPTVEVILQGNSQDAYVPHAEVMSGKYDIQCVFVPYFYKDIADKGSYDSLYLEKNYVDSISKANDYNYNVDFKVKYAAGTKEQTSKIYNVQWQGVNKVDTVTVVEDFEFPCSYKNLRWTYPTLVIAGKSKSKFTKNIIIDQIILRNKKNGAKVIVKPRN